MRKVSIISKSTEMRPNLGAIEKEIKYQNLDDLSNIICKYNWSPALFKENKRSKDTAIGTNLLVYDVDEGLTMVEANKRLRNYRHIIAPSKSHQKPKTTKSGSVKLACDRFRVVVFLEYFIDNVNDYEATWFKFFLSKLPEADQACKDLSRFYYACSGSGYKRSNGYNVKIVKASKVQTNTPKLKELGIKGNLGKKSLMFLNQLAPDGSVHMNLIRTAFDMKQQNYTCDEAIEEIRFAFNKNDRTFEKHDRNKVKDIFENRALKHDTLRWPKEIYNEKTGVCKLDKEDNDNYVFLIKNVLNWKVEKDVLRDIILINDEPISDSHLVKISLKAREHKLITKKDILNDYLTAIAEENEFHPLKDAIDKSTLDVKTLSKHKVEGGPIDKLIDTIKFTYYDDTGETREQQFERYRMYIRRWLVGVATKIYQPGSQNLVLVFIGKQGMGKSRWLTKLALTNWSFGEGHINPQNKDHVLYHLDKLIFHIPELDSITGKKESGELKDYLTKDHVVARRPYGRFATSGRSICSFCASVNHKEFLVDWTGSRRFLTIPIEGLDHEHNIKSEDVFKEALELYRAGYKHWLNIEEIAELNRINGIKHNYHTDLDDYVDLVIQGDDFVQQNQLMRMLGMNPNKRADYIRFKNLLLNRGHKLKRRKVKNKTLSGFLVDKSKLLEI